MRRRYYRVKKVYPKQKWLPVNNEVNIAGATVLANYYNMTVQPITENPSRNSADGSGNVSSASILKAGRFRFKGVLNSSSSGAISYIIGVSYIPEGYSVSQGTIALSTLGECFFYRHPEWILCWTRYDYTDTSQRNEFSMSSKLKRNLNSGDQIVVFRIAINNTSSQSSVSSMNGTISYVCRTN